MGLSVRVWTLGVLLGLIVALVACRSSESATPNPPTAVITPAQIAPTQPQSSPTAELSRTAVFTPSPLSPTGTAPAPLTPTSQPPYTYALPMTNANLRAGPGSNFPIVGTALRDEPLPIYGRNEDGSWFTVSLTETRWIWADLVVLTVDWTAIPLAVVVQPTEDAAVYLSPDLAATLQAHSNGATSTARAQFRHNATATIRAYAHHPPEGRWCAQNVTRRVCVFDFAYRRTVGPITADAESRFVIVGVEVTNLGSHQIEVYPGYLLLGLADGIQYPYANEIFHLADPLAWTQLNGGETISGQMLYIVKNDIAPVSVLYRDKLAEFEILINLKLPPDG